MEEQMTDFDLLKLENQLCFPLYAVSRLITRAYQPFLDKLGITYPQYLVLLVLWETDGLTVNEIGTKLILNTNTVTPLLKRMEAQGLIERNRSKDDERRVLVSLTVQGMEMRKDAVEIPLHLAEGLQSESLNVGELMQMKEVLKRLIDVLNTQEVNAAD
jgi:MarR family transcriptional regulator, organic hydroperoxide resistance regulator